MSDLFRLLIVDDDLNMNHTLADILMLSGFTVETAPHAEAALQKLDTMTFNCVVSDIVMPGMNGVELQKTIQEKYGNLPVLLITAYATNDLVHRARQQGALAFLEKPLDIPLLLSFLRAISAQASRPPASLDAA